jgi:pimeloyl-ACP methyl ester carboxylesterase
VTGPPVVLVHSPVLGPASWEPTARALSGRGWICLVPSLLEATSVAEHVALAASAVPDGAVLVAHSGAGALLPAVGEAAGRSIGAWVFVDAGMPPSEGPVPVTEPAMVDRLAGLARAGAVPPWSQWWGADVFADLVADADVRAVLASEMRTLPLDFFRTTVDVPAGWSEGGCAYLRLSHAYDREALEAERRGWVVERVDGSHLDVAVRPEVTAVALDGLLTRVVS